MAYSQVFVQSLIKAHKLEYEKNPLLHLFYRCQYYFLIFSEITEQISKRNEKKRKL